jgi:hypothetical protein
VLDASASLLLPLLLVPEHTGQLGADRRIAVVRDATDPTRSEAGTERGSEAASGSRTSKRFLGWPWKPLS